MPRRSKKNKGRQGMTRPTQSLKDTVISVPFSYTYFYSASTSTVLPINPNGISSRVLSLAEGFELYRVTKLKFRLINTSNSPGGYLTASYLPGIVDSSINLSNNTGNLNHVVTSTAPGVPPTSWCTVSRQALSGYFVWYKTLQGTPDPSEEIQGNIYVTQSGSTYAVVLEVRGVIEFKSACEPASTPARRDALFRAEYARITQILAEGQRLRMTELTNSAVTNMQARV